MSLWFHLGYSSCLGEVSRLGDGCGTLRISGVGVNWGLRAREGGGESGVTCLWGGVDGVAVLCDERGGGVDREFGLMPFHVKGLEPSCLTNCAQ